MMVFLNNDQKYSLFRNFLGRVVLLCGHHSFSQWCHGSVVIAPLSSTIITASLLLLCWQLASLLLLSHAQCFFTGNLQDSARFCKILQDSARFCKILYKVLQGYDYFLPYLICLSYQCASSCIRYVKYGK